MATPFTFASPDALDDLGTNSRRFQWNVQALRLLRALEDEGRTPTLEEQVTLAHYTAFGSSDLLQRAVRIVRHTGRYEPNDDLSGLISDDDAAAIARGAMTQFFTPLWVSQALGAIAERALEGVARPRILEPAAGIGMIIASLPPALRERAELVGVELDQATSRIFGHLHPDVRFFGATGFEDVELPEESFDLTISNVPFGGVRVTAPLFTRQERALTRTIHDFFIAKMLKLTRPGGYVVVLTSYGTMDKKNTTVRAWLAQRACLVGALRLPNGIFAENSGSASGTDILVFRRYAEGETPAPAPWVESVRCAIPRGEHTINAVTSQTMDYHTETMLGQPFIPGSPDVIGEYISFETTKQGRYGPEPTAMYVLQPPDERPALNHLEAPIVPA